MGYLIHKSCFHVCQISWNWLKFQPLNHMYIFAAHIMMHWVLWYVEHVPMGLSSYTLLSSWLIWKWLKSSSLTIDILAAHVKQTEFYVGLKSSSPPLYFQSGQIYVNEIPSHPGRPLFEYCIKCLIGTRLFKRKMSFSSFLFIDSSWRMQNFWDLQLCM